jgi:beta-xylosidase
VDWELISHAINRPGVMPLYSSRADNGRLFSLSLISLVSSSTPSGIWAPSLSFINGTFYMTSMTMWGSDPNARTWPRIFWVTSDDLKTWSDPVWSEPYGIDPHLFQDPKTLNNYLTMMGFNNGFDKIWGISQCRVDLKTGKCIGPYRNIWNGTLPVSSSARPEGPKLFFKDDSYYMIAAEGGTGITHRATIARSNSPEGPWESSPTNPLIFNGAYTNLTVGNTGHATFSDTPHGQWFGTFLAKRYSHGNSPLGRETFFAPVTWDNGWPTMNDGKLVLMSQSYDYAPDKEWPPPPFEDRFEGDDLALYWYQLRSPYTKNYQLGAETGDGPGLILIPNVYTLSDRDSPAAVLRKQISVNMTFTATLLPTNKALGPWESVGISAYTTEANHQDIGLRGCANATGMCLFTDSTINGPGPGVRPNTTELHLNISEIPSNFQLHIRSDPKMYKLGYSRGNATVTWVREFEPRLLPSGFDGAMFALYASGNSLPFSFDGPTVGFKSVSEVYHEERWEDFDSK